MKDEGEQGRSGRKNTRESEYRRRNMVTGADREDTKDTESGKCARK